MNERERVSSATYPEDDLGFVSHHAGTVARSTFCEGAEALKLGSDTLAGCKRDDAMDARSKDVDCTTATCIQVPQTSDSDNESLCGEDMVSPLKVLLDAIAHCRRLLVRKDKNSLEPLWHSLQLGLYEAMDILQDRVLSFGDSATEDQLERLRRDIGALAMALSLRVGDRVEVKYDDIFYEGTVTSVADILRGAGAEMVVRFDCDGNEAAVVLSDGEIRLLAAAAPANTLTGAPVGRKAHAPPFHVAGACVEGDEVEAVEALERAVMCLAVSLERLGGQANGRRAAVGLRLVVGEVRQRAAEVRGRLTGTWPSARLEERQTVLGWPKQRNGLAAPVRATVEAVSDRPDGRGERAKLRFTRAEGAWVEWVPRSEWADRVQAWPAEFPGGDGVGDVRADDPDKARLIPGERGDDECAAAGGEGGRGERGREAKRRRRG